MLVQKDLDRCSRSAIATGYRPARAARELARRLLYLTQAVLADSSRITFPPPGDRYLNAAIHIAAFFLAHGLRATASSRR